MGVKKKAAGSGNRASGVRVGTAAYFGGQSNTQANKPLAPAGGAAAYGALLSGGGGSGASSSYGGYSPAGAGTSAYNAAADPTYQAYIRALDVEQAQAQNAAAQRRQYLNADRDYLLGETARAGDLQREDIGNAMEDRGLFLSGARLRDQGRSSANQLAREGRIRSDTASQLSDLEVQLAQMLAQQQLRRQQAALGIFG